MGVFAKARIEAIMKGAGAERISANSIERMDELVSMIHNTDGEFKKKEVMRK